MNPALLVAAAPLLERLGVLAAGALEDLLVLDDAERADRVEALLDRADRRARRAADREALGQHRAALRDWRRAAAAAAKARRAGSTLFARPALLVPEPR